MVVPVTRKLWLVKLPEMLASFIIVFSSMDSFVLEKFHPRTKVLIPEGVNGIRYLLQKKLFHIRIA